MSVVFKCCQRLLTIAGLALVASCDPGGERAAYRVQLVRGSNAADPPEPDRPAVGPRLNASLTPVFSWKHYWEIARRDVSLRQGRKTRLRLSPLREVEIDLSLPGRRTVSAFADGRIISRLTQPVDQRIAVIGGDRDAASAWFIVVRPDDSTR